MGLSDADFWQRMTPRQYGALAERWRQQQEREDRRTARICATIYNCVLRPKEPINEDAFMPRLVRKEQAPQQQLAMVRALNTAFGGEVVKR